MKKRGQQTMGMPFGMIFSIILIVVFVVLAFIVVKHFLDIGKTAQSGLFFEDLQDNVDNAWKGQASEFVFEVNLPGEIQSICFANLSARITGHPDNYDAISIYRYEEANVFLLPPEKANNFEWYNINHLDIEKITLVSNPYCIEAGRDLIIKKGFYDKLVIIE